MSAPTAGKVGVCKTLTVTSPSHYSSARLASGTELLSYTLQSMSVNLDSLGYSIQSMSTTLDSFCNLFNIKSPCLMAAWYCAFLASGLRAARASVSFDSRLESRAIRPYKTAWRWATWLRVCFQAADVYLAMQFACHNCEYGRFGTTNHGRQHAMIAQRGVWQVEPHGVWGA